MIANQSFGAYFFFSHRHNVMSDHQSPLRSEQQGNPAEMSPPSTDDALLRREDVEEEDISDDNSSVSTIEDRLDEPKQKRQRKRRKEKSAKRTGNEKMDKLEERVQVDKYDTEAWAVIYQFFF